MEDERVLEGMLHSSVLKYQLCGKDSTFHVTCISPREYKGRCPIYGQKLPERARRSHAEHSELEGQDTPL